MAIALSHGGPTIYESDEPSREVLVGTLRGVTRLVKDGAGWRAVGDCLTDQHISAILVEPESGAIFAGAYGGGSLRVSRDGGTSWESCSNGLSESEIFSIEAVQLNGRTRIYVGTEPARLFFSDDLGRSWSELVNLRSVPTVENWSFPAPPHVAHAKQIAFHPSRPSTMYVSIEVGGLLRSDDHGQTWQDVPGMYEDVHRLVINPADPRRMFVSGGNGIYVSEDEGATWMHATTREHELGGYPDQLVYQPGNPDTMFVASAQHGPGAWRETHFAGARISRSRDGGRTWEILRAGLPDRMQGNIEAMCLEESDAGCAIFAATTAGEVFASEDGGESWQAIVTGLAPISKGGHYRNLMAATATP